MMLPDGPNQRWSVDFISYTFACSRRFRILSLVDYYTRECLALVATHRCLVCGSLGN